MHKNKYCKHAQDWKEKHTIAWTIIFLNLFIFLIFRFFYIEISLFAVIITFPHLSLIPCALLSYCISTFFQHFRDGRENLKDRNSHKIPDCWKRIPERGRSTEWVSLVRKTCDGHSPAEIVLHNSEIPKPVSAQPSPGCRCQKPQAKAQIPNSDKQTPALMWEWPQGFIW